MNRLPHVALATVFAFLTAFLTWIWLLSGGFSLKTCGAPMCGYTPNHANVTFVSMGFLSAILFGVECVNLATSKRRWNTGYESQRQRRIRMIGAVSSLFGVFLAGYGIFELNTTIMGCNAYVCGSLPLSYYASFYLGLSLVATGAILMLMAMFVQPGFKLPSQTERPLPRRI